MENNSRRLRVPGENEEWAMEIPLPDQEQGTGNGEQGSGESSMGSSSTSSTYSTFLKIGRFAMFALVFLVPLFFLPFTQFPVESGKIIAVSILVLAAFVSFLVCVVEKRALEYPRSLLALAVGVFAAVIGLGTLFSTSSLLSLYGKLVQPDSFLAALLYAGAFFFSFYFFTNEDLPKIGKLFLWSLGLVTVYGILQMYGWYLLPWAFTKSTAFNTLGTTFGWGVFMAAVLIGIVEKGPEDRLRGEDGLQKGKPLAIGHWLLAILFTIGLLVVNFQFLWIALLVAFLVVAAMRFMEHGNYRLPLVLAAIALLLAIIGSRLPTGAATVTEVRPNLSATWGVALDAIHGVRLFLGNGPSTFSEVFTRFRTIGLNATNFWTVPFSQGYDFFLTLLATAGVLGVLAFLFVLFGFARLIGFVSRQDEAGRIKPLVMPLIFLAAMLLFYPGFLTLMLALFVGFALLILQTDSRRAVSFEKLGRKLLFTVFIAALLLGVASLVAAYRIIEKYSASSAYADAVSSLNAGNLPAAAASIQTSVSLDNSVDDSWRVGSQVAFAQAQQLFQQASGTLNAQTEAAISAALTAAQNATKLDPNNVFNWEALGSVYQGLIPIANGADALAVAAYQSAEKIDPYNPDLPIAIARVDAASAARLQQLNQKDAAQAKLSDAETQLQNSINLKPDYATPQFLLAQLYIQEGSVDKAIARVQQIEQANPLDAGLAFQLGLLYYQNSQTAEARQEFARAVSLDNNYSNARYFLGLIDDQQGNKSDAIAQFTAIKQLNPDNAEVQQILNNLQANKPALSGISPPAPAPQNAANVPVPEASSTTGR
ncbi:MAG: tetratricopeptide repeat protein [Patescibacteria group bacterium]|nr:tetratricopeptide repeat protein [Patescibacteria group bacterium]